jgi:hypothetical protein
MDVYNKFKMVLPNMNHTYLLRQESRCGKSVKYYTISDNNNEAEWFKYRNVLTGNVWRCLI